MGKPRIEWQEERRPYLVISAKAYRTISIIALLGVLTWFVEMWKPLPIPLRFLSLFGIGLCLALSFFIRAEKEVQP